MDKELEIERLKQELAALRKENESLKNKQPLRSNNKHSDEFWEKVEKACKYDIDSIKLLVKNKTIQMDDTDKYGRTLLILSAMCGSYELTQLCLNLGADVDHKSDLGRNALNESELFADVKQLLLFSELNANFGNRIKSTAYIINKQRGFIENIQSQLSKYDTTTSQFFKDTLIDLMINIISNKLAFSDDLLNLCWFFETNPLQSKLWLAIEKVCTEIIQNGNKKEWHWIKTFVIPSTIWYIDVSAQDSKTQDIWHKTYTNKSRTSRKVNKRKSYLYYRLLQIVDIQSVIELEKLKEDLMTVANTDKISWNTLVQYDMQRDYEYAFVRQDLIPNAIEAKYTFESLLENSSPSAAFNSHRFYDHNQYLPDLILLAHIVDDEFQKSVQQIFSINKHTNVGYIATEDEKQQQSDALMVQYVRGPVKIMERAISKADTDYFDQDFPTSACILDVNRCALVFNDIKTLLFALNMFRNKVKYYQSGSIIGIVRDKNRFKDYINEVQYADIKLNVLIKGKRNNIIGEVQFLLQTMLDFKKKAHNLYLIERQQEYIQHSVSLILPTLIDPIKQLWIAANMDDVNALADLMIISNKTEEFIMGYGDYRETILHSICAKGCDKALAFLQSIISEELFIKCLLLFNNNNTTSIEQAIENGHIRVVKRIFAMERIKNMYINDKNLAFRLLVWLFGFCWNEQLIDFALFVLDISSAQMVEFLSYKYVIKNEDESKVDQGAHDYCNYVLLCCVTRFNDVEILQKLVSVIGDKIFVQYVFVADNMNINAMEYAIKTSKLKMIEYMISFDDIKEMILKNENMLWRIVWLMYDKFNASVVKYLMNILQLNETKLKKLQSFKYEEENKRQYHEKARKYASYSISDEMINKLLNQTRGTK